MDNKADNKEIGLKIKNLRKSKKMTQQQLADLIYKTESSIRKYEKGLVEIPISVILQIANVFELDHKDLLNSDEIELAYKNSIIEGHKNSLVKTISKIDPNEQIRLLRSFDKTIDYITRVPLSTGEREGTISRLCDLLNRYSEVIMNGIELSSGTSQRNEDYLLLLRNYENSIRLINEHKEAMLKLAISLSENECTLLEFLERNK